MNTITMSPSTKVWQSGRKAFHLSYPFGLVMQTEDDRIFLQRIDLAPVPACISVWRISPIAIALKDKMSVRDRMLASDVPRVLSTCQLATWARKSD
jgi:hypothetical protein